MQPFLILETGHPAQPLRRYGSFAHWIRVAAGLERDAAIAIDVERGQALPTREGFAGVFVTGSAAMVTEHLDWSERCADWLRAAAAAGLPILGICYGHQLLAYALGGEVDYNPNGREMGTVALDLSPAAADDPLFSGISGPLLVQSTHRQSVLRPPPGAVVLASNAHDGCHAMRCGKAAWGVQFHPEFSAEHMRGYIRARAEALADEGVGAQTLLDGVDAAPDARRVLRRFVRHARR